MISVLLKRRGATLAGLFSLALSSAVLLCGAGSVPIENLLPQGAMQGDLNAGGHNVTNAATIYATNVVVSGSLSAPLTFAQLTGTPTTLAGYGIADPIVLTSGSYANPVWLTSLAASKLTGLTPAATNSAAYMQPGNNLSDVASAATARGNLGLGTMATNNVPIPYGYISGLGTAATSNIGAFDASGSAAAAQSAAQTFASNGTNLTSGTVAYSKLTGSPAALSLTTTGSSGAATYNSGTGVMNVPQYSGGGGSFGYVSESVSSASIATNSVLGLTSADSITLGAGSGAYVAARALSDSGFAAGDIYVFQASMPASTNAALAVYDGGYTGNPISTVPQTGVAYTATRKFLFSGSHWTPIPASDAPSMSAATVSNSTNNPVTIGTTTTSYGGPGSGSTSALAVQLNNTVSGSAVAPINLTMDVVPPDNVTISPALGIEDTIFLHTGSNTTAAPGNVSATGLRATITNRGTGNVNTIAGVEDHVGNQTSSYGGGGTLALCLGFHAVTPLADASDPITNATGILIDAQSITGVTTGYGIDQEGTSDTNVLKASTDSIYGNFSLLGTSGTDIGLFGSQKLGFWGATPVVQQTGDVLAALLAEGLVTAPTLGGNDVNPFVCSTSSTISNTTTASFITLGTGKGNYTFAANKLVAGSTYVLHMAGYYSTTGTPTLALIFGTYSSGLATTFGTTGAVTLPSGVTQYEWEADYEFTVQTTGSSGTLIGQGWAHIETGAGTVAVYPMLNTSTTTINTTASNSVLGFVQWGTAASGNTITCTNANFRQVY